MHAYIVPLEMDEDKVGWNECMCDTEYVEAIARPGAMRERERERKEMLKHNIMVNCCSYTNCS